MLAGLAWSRPGATPAPESATLADPLEALLEIEIVPEALAAALGVNVMLRVAF